MICITSIFLRLLTGEVDPTEVRLSNNIYYSY